MKAYSSVKIKPPSECLCSSFCMEMAKNKNLLAISSNLSILKLRMLGAFVFDTNKGKSIKQRKKWLKIVEGPNISK